MAALALTALLGWAAPPPPLDSEAIQAKRPPKRARVAAAPDRPLPVRYDEITTAALTELLVADHAPLGPSPAPVLYCALQRLFQAALRSLARLQPLVRTLRFSVEFRPILFVDFRTMSRRVE